MLVSLVACLLVVGEVAPVEAARARREVPSASHGEVPSADRLVIKIQKALAKAGYYHGPEDGRLGHQITKAIRAYQQHAGLPVDGEATEKLLEHLETGDKVALLLGRLEQAREENIKAARKALLSRPETRHLLEKRDDGVADPTRDPTPCFRDPTVSCLLAEAAESAKAISKPELRDWVLGELLVAQAKAGYTEDAMETARRMGDPRLIMVALRDIAEAQAMAGRADDAAASAAIIPDPLKQTEALVAIAAIQAERGDVGDARLTANHLLTAAKALQGQQQRIAFQARAAVIFASAGDPGRATEHLREAERLARAQKTPEDREEALRHVAGAMADMHQSDRALEILKDIRGISERTPVLVSAATSRARAGDSARALVIAADIEAERYRALVLAQIAVAQGGRGQMPEALATLDKSVEATRTIKLPYARSYAMSRIALALAELGKTDGGATLGRALDTAEAIEDDRLRAHVLWVVAAESSRLGRAQEAVRAETLARKATQDIKSSLSRVWMFADIASLRLAASEVEPAWTIFREGLSAAEAIHNAWGRSRALARLATILIELADPAARQRAQPSLDRPLPE